MEHWTQTCFDVSVRSGRSVESVGYGGKLKNFPKPILKILPAALMLAPLVSILDGCHASTPSVEASTTRIPVVAPAGTVLRVRLDQTLDSERSRPGDRFTGVLESPVVAGGTELLPKGTLIEGHVLSAHQSGRNGEDSLLVLTLDSYERAGRYYALATNSLTRSAHPGSRISELVSVPADSIMGFTLASTLTA